jgi:hypothetical protein
VMSEREDGERFICVLIFVIFFYLLKKKKKKFQHLLYLLINRGDVDYQMYSYSDPMLLTLNVVNFSNTLYHFCRYFGSKI